MRGESSNQVDLSTRTAVPYPGHGQQQDAAKRGLSATCTCVSEKSSLLICINLTSGVKVHFVVSFLEQQGVDMRCISSLELEKTSRLTALLVAHGMCPQVAHAVFRIIRKLQESARRSPVSYDRQFLLVRDDLAIEFGSGAYCIHENHEAACEVSC